MPRNLRRSRRRKSRDTRSVPFWFRRSSRATQHIRRPSILACRLRKRMPPTSSSLTVTSNGGLLRVLQCPCSVAEAFDPTAPPSPVPTFRQYQAVWDTGATNTAITQRVIDECGLKPITLTKVRHAGGESMSEVFLVMIGLPNGVGFHGCRVTRSQMHPGSDVLIGMDIITTGDFAITNTNGLTVFTFCVPSHRRFDFVKEHNQAQQAAVGKPGFRGYNPP